jgi:glycosyltransferase involved in cell wall biosynthesis
VTRRVVMLAPFGLRPKATLSQRMVPLAAALGERGWRCTIVAPSYTEPRDAGTREIIQGVPVEHVRLARLPGALGVIETSAHMLAAARRWQPDLIHVFKPKGYSGVAALLAHWLLPHVPQVQDTDDWEGWGGWNELGAYSCPMKHIFAWQERTLPRRAAAVTVASRTLETQVWGFGVDPRRVVYLPNGVAPQPPVLPARADARATLDLHDAQVILLYTRFWEYPLHDIIDFLLVLQSRRPDARLLVVGDGERGEAAALRRLARRAGVAHMADIRGWSDRATIDAAFAATDLAIMPFADTLMNRAKCSVKLLELLAAGVPVVASRVGQAAEYIIHRQTGILVDPGGVPLAQGALELLADPALRERLGIAAAAHVTTTWNWTTLAARLAGWYEIATNDTTTDQRQTTSDR